MDGCSGFPPDLKTTSDTQYSLDGSKNCSNPFGLLQPFFHNKKAQVPYLQTHVFIFIQAVLLTRGSLALCSLLRKLPMTSFR